MRYRLVPGLSLLRVLFEVDHIEENTCSEHDGFHVDFQVDREGYAEGISVITRVVSSPLFTDLTDRVSVQVDELEVDVSAATRGEAAALDAARTSDGEILEPLLVSHAEAGSAEAELLLHSADADSGRREDVDLVVAADARTTEVDHFTAGVVGDPHLERSTAAAAATHAVPRAVRRLLHRVEQVQTRMILDVVSVLCLHGVRRLQRFTLLLHPEEVQRYEVL